MLVQVAFGCFVWFMLYKVIFQIIEGSFRCFWVVYIVSVCKVCVPTCWSLSEVRVVRVIQAAPSVTFVHVVSCCFRYIVCVLCCFKQFKVVLVVVGCSKLLLVILICRWLF